MRPHRTTINTCPPFRKDNHTTHHAYTTSHVLMSNEHNTNHPNRTVLETDTQTQPHENTRNQTCRTANQLLETEIRSAHILALLNAYRLFRMRYGRSEAPACVSLLPTSFLPSSLTIKFYDPCLITTPT
ncbi:Hypothetical predicted protein [Pelobates cultripes]|uniref:Uncharacterized protein n=1 Tax=Pelobates cultripes TaxID=61616 RepID=A0AAD1W8M3_PELCU|nr:Hypothetical predicted protein [Pelobates cultripes]